MIKRILTGLAFAAALALAPGTSYAAATTQTTHAWLCMPAQAAGPQARRVAVPTTSGGTYQLNAGGCALITAADIPWFISQGAYYGPNIFTLTQTGITANTTSATSAITLPAYAFIIGVILEETAGNAITGGVNIGDAGSATRFASAVALGANATVSVADSALTRLYLASGVPTVDQVLVACASSCNSGSINITILYSYF